MEFNQTARLNPYLNGAGGQQGIHTVYENNAASAGTKSASFQDSVKNALKTTESMESIFQEAAQLYGLDVNFLKAIGKAESGFNSQAVSSAGAQGVMQLMPATARSLGVEDSFDARSNIMGGAKYIAGLLERYQGNVEKYGGSPPFKETQNYVQKVLSYAGEDMDLSGILTTGAAGGSAYQSAVDLLSQLAAGTGSMGLAFSQEDAQYMVELMRLKMETMFNSQVLSDEEESGAVDSLI